MPDTLQRHVAAHLRNTAASITERWVTLLTERLHTQPGGVLPGDTILNQMPNILASLADFVGGELDRPLEEHLRGDLIRLADLRRRQGYGIDEVLIEFSLLGQLIRTEILIAVDAYEGEASRRQVVQVVGDVMEAFHLLDTATAARFRVWHSREQQERSRLLGSYTAMLSHELASRLGAAETALKLILSDKPLTVQRLRRLHGLVFQSIQSGLDTVRDVHALFEAQDPESAVQSSTFPLSVLVRDIVHQVRIGATLRGVRVELVNNDGDDVVDAERFPLAFYNLLNNAVRHHDIPNGTGTVRVEVSKLGGELHVSVKDDGPGLSDVARARLFHPHIHHSASTRHGLGLAIAAEAIAQMNGTLSADPPHGRGTTFRITIPLDRAGPGSS